MRPAGAETAVAPAGVTPLIPLAASGDADPCSRCTGYLLPGAVQPHPRLKYRIDSDLPEIFLSTGTLYTTAPVLPEFLTKAGQPVSESQRRQRNGGFTTIDGDFEVFVYHMSNPGVGASAGEPRQRRVVVYVKNTGRSDVTVSPRQIMESAGTMARADGPESRLSRRMLADEYDRPVAPLTLAPGGEGVIGYSPRLSTKDGSDADASPSDFFNGMVQAEVKAANGRPSLEVSVVAIDAAVPAAEFAKAAAAAAVRGAHSGEGGMDLQIPPPQCHIRRVVGVMPGFIWKSEPVVVDMSALPRSAKAELSDEPMTEERRKRSAGSVPGIAFLMAAPAEQTRSCPLARQTADMLLHPGYVHADTVGNYQVEYFVTLTLVNPSDTPRHVDLRFGKQDADVGLAWQVVTGDGPASAAELAAAPIQLQWAGGWRKDDLPDNTRSLFAPAAGIPGEPSVTAAITLEPRSARTVSLRLMPVGTSSLPFFLYVVPE
jgi:hypothetical protein